MIASIRLRKDAVRAGQPITDEEATFVGLYVPRTSALGWRSADEIMPMFELTEDGRSAEVAALLAMLMGVGQRDRLEFLGG